MRKVAPVIARSLFRSLLPRQKTWPTTLGMAGMALLVSLWVTGCDSGGANGPAPQPSPEPETSLQLPPDPAKVAPELSPTEYTSMVDATAFLYTGDNPIQTGVTEGTIEEDRVAVVRGQVVDRANNPIPGVTITIKDHSEYGQTLSRADGWFDLAVNGGGQLTIDYEKDGYLPLQRQITTPWQDFVVVDQVVMIALDPQVTTVDLVNNDTLQTAQGSEQTDADGTRQATVLFPVGTTATMTLPNGSTQTLSSLAVRATEYTVGENGAETMPGELPIHSGYTYAVELSVDEAIQAGATEVTFNQPLPVYVDNFLGFPTGEAVPLGWYDREQAAWIAADNGRVIEIISVTDTGLAELDTDGDGAADSQEALEALGISAAERTYLAETYSAGKTLWRVQLEHFTPWDFNWPAGPPADAIAPPVKDGVSDDENGENNDDLDLNSEDGDMCKGSIVTPQGQVLGETLPIAGTPYSLNYSSNRAPGYRSNALLNIPLAGDTVPTSLQKVEVEVYISGKNYRKTFTSVSPHQHYEFEWDGRDTWGRRESSAVAEVDITYHYRLNYFSSRSQWKRSFNQFGDRSTVIGSRAEDTIEVNSDWRRQLTLEAPHTRVDTQLGLWNLNVHHSYNPQSEVLYKGTGEKRHAAYQSSRIGEHVAGSFYYSTYVNSKDADDIPALGAKLTHIQGMAFSSDGNLYIAESDGHRIRKVTPDGIIHTIAGTGEKKSFGDGSQATEVGLNYPTEVAVADNGSIYISDWGGGVVRQITPDGIIRTVAGAPDLSFDEILSASGGPALNKKLLPDALAVAPDGTLYIGDYYTNGIYKVDQAGDIYMVVGPDRSGYDSDYEDGGPAVKAYLGSPYGMAFDKDGTLYIAGGRGGFKLTPAGELTRILTEETHAVSVDQEGNVYFTREKEFGLGEVVKLLSNGEFVAVAGGGKNFLDSVAPALKHNTWSLNSLTVDPEGNLYAGAFYGVHKISSGNISIVDDSEIFVPDANGALSFVFNQSGKHLRTVSTTTGQSIYTFGYDDQGHLARITDLNGNFTQIERQADGTPTAIVSPDGQYTTLAVNADGYLASVTNPLFESHTMNYRSDGLLTQFTDPMGNSSRFTYGQNGRLISDTNAANGGWTLSRSGAETTLTSGEGRKSLFSVQKRYDGSTLKVNTAPDGSQTRTLMAADGSQTVTLANDMTIYTEAGADPRFGMSAPVNVVTRITTPSGLVKEVTRERLAELDDENNLFNPLELVEKLWVNDDSVFMSGDHHRSTYDAETNTWTHITPGNDSRTDTLNDKGQLSQSKTAGIQSVNYRYDDRGRLVQLDRGDNATRITSFEYDLQGNLSRVTNARDQSIFYTNDALGRVLSQTDQNGHTVHYEYDANGNLTQLTLPSGERHQFSYTAVNQQEDYTPPAPDADATTGTVASNHPTTHYTYNMDKQLTQVLRPDGETLSYTYDIDSGQFRTLATRAGEYAYEYYGDAATDALTGQLKQVTAPGAQRTAYQYDGSLLTDITWNGPVNGTIEYEYNNRFQAVAQTVNGETLAMSYSKDGQLIDAGTLELFHSSGNGLLYLTRLGDLETELDYNVYGELANYTTDYNANNLYQYALNRDESGRIIGKTETLGGTTTDYEYAYDASERLESVTENGVIIQRWGYDKNGNRTHENGSLVANYDAQNRLIGYKDNEYRYTANGELTEKADTATNETTQFQYDAFSNLRSVTLPDSTEIEYIIDGQNRRVGKLRNGTLEQGFLYQGQLNPVAELDGNNNLVARFVYGDKINVPSYMIKDGTNYRIVSDHLGSVRLVVNSQTGEVVQRLDYDAWGNVTQDTNPGFQPFGYAGGIYDRDTNLVRFGARDYDPEIGRWTTKDPIGFAGGLNHYGYVSNDPISKLDPTGLDAIFVHYVGYPVGVTENISIPAGHAGVIAVNPADGSTAYYEFGRYGGEYGDVMGPYDVGTVHFDENGNPTPESINDVITNASDSYGKGYWPYHVYTDKPYQDVVDYANKRSEQAIDGSRPYNFLFDNCKNFGREAAGAVQQ